MSRRTELYDGMCDEVCRNAVRGDAGRETQLDAGDEAYMGEALMEAGRASALQETPIGAVVVDASGAVIGRGCNMRETWRDPTAHAEMIALRDAARVTGDWRLYGCRLYVTVEPCLMCAGAIVSSRIETVVFGARNPKGGAFGSILDVQDLTGLNHYPCVQAGILEDRCAMMITDFFRGKRRGQVR